MTQFSTATFRTSLNLKVRTPSGVLAFDTGFPGTARRKACVPGLFLHTSGDLKTLVAPPRKINGRRTPLAGYSSRLGLLSKTLEREVGNQSEKQSVIEDHDGHCSSNSGDPGDGISAIRLRAQL